jgi:uncharacterized secreted repeat protein (TIGR03808 family)
MSPILDRRSTLFATALAGGAVAGFSATAAEAKPRPALAPTVTGLEPGRAVDQSAALQQAIDAAHANGAAVVLPPGQFRVSGIRLPDRARLIGHGATLVAHRPGPILTASGLDALRLDGLTLDGDRHRLSESRLGLLTVEEVKDLSLVDVTIRNAEATGLRLDRTGGRIHGCTLHGLQTGIWCHDSTGLDIAHNVITDCADNGLLIWRSRHGEDGTIAAFNRIQRITARSGGSGQYGNGINVYRAGRVQVTGNRITDCAYSAVRANEASNVQIVTNSAERIGEVALYVEAADERTGAAGYEGALVANNTVDTAATGIVVTNFNNGGRLAVVQGNLVRNLQRREHEPVDKRGEGIAVEADAVVANNVIENAPTAGLWIGWGRHMREVVATGNLIRKARIGIAVSAAGGAGPCVLANNMISDAREGAIRMTDHARAHGVDLIDGRSPKHIALMGNVAV